MSQAMPPSARDEYHAGGEELTPAPPRRPQRDWAAPPPWAGAAAAGAAGAATGGGGAGPAGAAGAAAGATPIDDTPAEARGLAGSAADRLAGPDPADPLSPGPTRASPPPDRYAPPASAADDLDDELRDDAPPVAAAAGAWAASSIADLDDDEPDWSSQQHDLPPAERRATASRPPARDDSRPPAPNPHDQVSRRQPQDPNELFGPAWERPHRYEAYPSLRTRVGLPGMSGVGRVGIAALALFVAAFALFFVGPMLLGIGDNSGGGAGATSTPIAEETASPAPTPVPEPTPTIYVVKKGDTMSKIANKYDVTVDELLAANPKIKNPNKISIGDEVTIPVPTSEEASS